MVIECREIVKRYLFMKWHAIGLSLPSNSLLTIGYLAQQDSYYKKVHFPSSGFKLEMDLEGQNV